MTEPLVPTPAKPSPLRRLGRFCHRRYGVVIGAWVVAIIVLNGVSGALGTKFSESFNDFDSEATRGFELLESGFGGSAGENQGTIVFVADAGVDDPEVQATMEELFAGVAAIEGLEVQSPYDEGADGQVAFEGDLAGRLAFARVAFPSDTNFSDLVLLGDQVRELLPAGDTGAQGDGLRIELGGQPFADFEPPSSEVIGIGFAIVILIAAFGSVLAMGLPIGMALAGIASGVAVVGIATQFVAMPDFTLVVALMIGLGVGIDYALFIVVRYREDLHHGMEANAAAGHAIDTAGRAVIFAGITVIISLLGMLVMGLDFIRGIGIGSAIPVFTTLIASITLLPALLGLVGDRLDVTRRRGLIAAGIVAISLVGIGLGIDQAVYGLLVAALVVVVGFFASWLKQPLPPRRQKPPRETFWYRYSRMIQRRPWPAALGGFAILIVLALPVLGIRLGFSDEGNYPEESTTRQAYELLSDGFGPGFNGPLFLVAEVPDGTDPADLAAITETLQGTDGVKFVMGPEVSEDGSVARWFTMPTTGPQDEDTAALIGQLREQVLPQVADETGVDVLVSSFTALSVDFSNYLGSRYPYFFGAILGLSFLLLMGVFRSVLVPLKAVLVNLLSIGAAYGIVVAMFQWGWGASLFDVSGGAPIEPFIPMMLFAIVFGLSMDYEVFLLSRMKEEYDRTGDNAGAVADGLAVTARVITAAAAIMVVVFGSFLLETDRVVKLMGVGLAVAVFLDATIVRMLLVPATMELLGDRNWWLPRWLDRIIPRIDVEGGHDEVHHALFEEDDEPTSPDVEGADDLVESSSVTQ